MLGAIIGDIVGSRWEFEREWVHDLARSYVNATEMKTQMAKRCGMVHWQEWADKYHLPVSLIGYIFKHTADPGMFMHECVGSFLSFLDKNYMLTGKPFSMCGKC